MSDPLDLEQVNVVELLTKLGIQGIRPEGKEVRFSCPMPAHSFGDRSPSAYMNKDTTAWVCFSCGAQGNAVTFLADVKNVSRATARRWIAEKWAPHQTHIEDLAGYVARVLAHEEQESVEPFVPLPEEEYEKRWVDWRSANTQIPWVDYMLNKRGFSWEILNEFEVGYDDIADRPCVTVRERDGSLVGFKGRAYREDQNMKYLVIGDSERSIAFFGERYGFAPYDAAQHVFGIHKAKPIDGVLNFVEGELNVISMHQKGFTNTLGPSGSTVTEKQVADVVSMCDEVVILFDSDLRDMASATTAKIKVLKAAAMFEPYVRVRICADHQGDPAELDVDTLRSLVDTAKYSVAYRVEHLMLTDV